MKVKVRFFAQLRDVTGRSEWETDLAAGATAGELVEKIYGQFPALRANDKSILLGVGVEFVSRDYSLNPGDEVSIMPPVQGG